MNPRGNERHLCNLQIMKLASHEKFTSMTHYNLVHKFIPMRKTMKNSGCKSCRGQGMDNAQDNTSMTSGQSHEQEGGDRWSTKRQKECPLCHIDGLMSPSKMRSFNPNHRITKAESCLGWHCNIRPWSLRIFLEQGSSASQMIAAKIMDVSARLRACDGQTVGAVSAYTQVKLEDAPRLLAQHS